MASYFCLKCGSELREVEDIHAAEIKIKQGNREMTLSLEDLVYECPKCKFMIHVDLSDEWKE